MDDDIEDFTEKVKSGEYKLRRLLETPRAVVVVSNDNPMDILRCFVRDILQNENVVSVDARVHRISMMYDVNSGQIYSDAPYGEGTEDLTLVLYEESYGVYVDPFARCCYVARSQEEADEFVDMGYNLITEFWLIENGRKVRKVHVYPLRTPLDELKESLKKARHH